MEPYSGHSQKVWNLVRTTYVMERARGLLPHVDLSSVLRATPNTRVHRKSARETGGWKLLPLNAQQQSVLCYKAPSPHPAPLCSRSAQLFAWLLLNLFGQCPLKDSYCRECSCRLCNCSADAVMVSPRIQPATVMIQLACLAWWDHFHFIITVIFSSIIPEYF